MDTNRRHPFHKYVGRFAPSPSGPLHSGSLVAAMASYLDARAHKGRWLVRIEDLDAGRSIDGADTLILAQLQALDMHWDGDVIWQSSRLHAYERAFDALMAQGLIYGCACSRQQAGVGRRYPGTCRSGLPAGRTARSWRFRTEAGPLQFTDRWHGAQCQNVEAEMGDFVVRRADGQWAYQLAVVVDDGAQGITDIVRGADLLDSTGAQQLLAGRLGLAIPRVMHVPVMRDAAGRKLSKQNHAPALDCAEPVAALNQAWQQLGFTHLAAHDPSEFWRMALHCWATRFEIPG